MLSSQFADFGQSNFLRFSPYGWMSFGQGEPDVVFRWVVQFFPVSFQPFFIFRLCRQASAVKQGKKSGETR
jgi:hypothetical protein